jgi:hypothetical protein
MRPTVAVDDLILWLGTGILGLAWFTIAAVSMDGLVATTENAFLPKPAVALAARARESRPDRSRCDVLDAKDGCGIGF